MAEDTTAVDAEEGMEEKKSGKLKLILIIVVVLLVLALGGVGALLFLGGDDESAEQAVAEPARPAQALYTKIRTLEGNPSFTVSVQSNDGRTHYLQVYVEAKSREDEVVAAMTKHMPKIVAKLNQLFSRQTLAILRTAEGKKSLQLAAQQEVQAVLQEKIGKPGIEKILFTGFIMQ
ncbi:flagellar basal body-associated FliL family protein [Amphritea sp. HPY]|uniref:flagellar basal body-associated FliL family protein n=1 Tax=Amphritea sp. HPY TaxID=3421652 RepID=UPI003D7EC2BF